MRDAYDLEQLDHGFRWGPMTVLRWISDDKIGLLLGIETADRVVQLASSPKGKSIRVWIDGVRYVPETGGK